MCVMLSVAIAAAAVMLIFVPSCDAYFPTTSADFSYFAVLFFAGILCGLFPRVFFPLFIVMYVALSIFTTVVLYRRFGLQSDTIAVTVADRDVLIDKTTYDLPVAPGEEPSVSFIVYQLPAKLLVPLPRTWYMQNGVFSASHESLVRSPSVPQLSAPQKGTFENYLLSAPQTQTCTLSAASYYPALYTITVRRHLAAVSFTVARSF